MESNNEVIKITSPRQSILHITLNRPQQLNALNHQLLTSLANLFSDIKADSTIKAVLISGEGKAFCAGADIKQLASLDVKSGVNFARFGQSVFRQLELLGKPSLAAIHGFAFGGGCELAMAASLRIASDNAQFGQPEIKLGVIPGFGGTQRLSRLVGKGRALDICLTGRRFSAAEAHSWGLLNEVTTAENLQNRAIAILDEITKMPAFAANNILNTIHYGYDLSLDDAMEMEATAFGLCCGTEDKQEGVTAFLEKRAPVFNGE